MMATDDVIEQTLYICRAVSVYRVPPRTASGHRSGEWRVADKIFEGRLRVIARGELLEVRLEDVNNGDLFAVAPVPLGKKDIVVEAATDSSRYFVLRVEDPASKRHAFLGMGFNERGDAFDFNVALTDHEKHLQRAKAAQLAEASGSAAPAAAVDPAVASLYKGTGDLSLKEGQTIRINVARKNSSGGSGSSGSSLLKGPLVPLAPPPAAGTKVGAGVLPPPPAAPAAAAPGGLRVSDPGWGVPAPSLGAAASGAAAAAAAAAGDLLGFNGLLGAATSSMAHASLTGAGAAGAAPSPSAAAAAAPKVVATSEDSWASFD